MLSAVVNLSCLWCIIAFRSSQGLELLPAEENSNLTLSCSGEAYIHRGWYQGHLDNLQSIHNVGPFYKQLHGARPVGHGLDGLTLDNETFELTVHQVELQDDGRNFTCRTYTRDLMEIYTHVSLQVYIQPQIELSSLENKTFRENTKMTVSCSIDRLYPRLPPDSFIMYWGGYIEAAVETQIDNDTFNYEVQMTKVLTAQDDQVMVNCSVSPIRGSQVSVARTLHILGGEQDGLSLYLIIIAVAAAAGTVVVIIVITITICLCRRGKDKEIKPIAQPTKYAPTKAEIEESIKTPPVYETLDPETKNSIDEWMDRNRILPSTKEKLRRQDIKSILSMQMLSPEDIAELGITIGERNRLKAALATLQE